MSFSRGYMNLRRPILSRLYGTGLGSPTLQPVFPPLHMALQPDFGPHRRLFPLLPEIHTPEIRLQVFTHRSYAARPTHIFEDHPDDPSPDNEKYEHVGDTVLGLCVTTLLYEMYPGLHVGPSTKVRALMVGNATLAEISLLYKLPSRLRLHPAQAVTLRASVHIQADVLESFIGGLYIEQGLDAVRRWLNPLFRPYAECAYRLIREQHGLPSDLIPCPSLSSSSSSLSSSGDSAPEVANIPPDPLTTSGHLALFNQHIQKADRQVEWVYSDKPDGEQIAPKGTKTTPVWFVKVLLDGQLYGSGRGNTKKAARNEAAKIGLETMGIIVWYVDKCLQTFPEAHKVWL